MAMFAKKPDWEHKASTEIGGTVAAAPAAAGARGYGIAEAIQLMRGLPVEQNAELVVRVVRATLASLNVKLPDIIEDATRKQKATQDRITAEHGQVAELEKQLEIHRKEIASLEADLKETSAVKERLQQAEKLASVVLAPVPAPAPAPASTLPNTATLIGHKPD